MDYEVLPCFIIAALLGSAGLWFVKSRKKRLAGVLFFLALITFAIGVIKPTFLNNFFLKEEKLERFEPSPEKRQAMIQAAMDKPSPESEKRLEKLAGEAESRPENGRAPEDYLVLALKKFLAKNYDSALADVDAGLKLNPRVKRVKALLLHRKASVFYSRGLLDEGMKYYRESIEADPHFHWPHNNLGLIFRKQGKLEEAEANYKEAIRLNPEFFESHYNLGNLYFGQGKWKEAETIYLKAIQLNPKFPGTHYNLGILYQTQGILEKAEANYREAVRLDPEKFEAHLNLGSLYEKQGRLKEAQAEYEEALRLKPDYISAREKIEIIKRKMEGGG